jgi:hypothetical protein
MRHHAKDYPDMVALAYIFFEEGSSRDFTSE